MPNEPTSQLVRDLKTYCMERGVKQNDLASTLGVTPAAVTEWFHGRSHPSGKLIVQIMALLKTKRKKKSKPEIDGNDAAKDMEF
jgi:transcriptional regulator with XRE-family HTH domain